MNVSASTENSLDPKPGTPRWIVAGIVAVVMVGLGYFLSTREAVLERLCAPLLAEQQAEAKALEDSAASFPKRAAEAAPEDVDRSLPEWVEPRWDEILERSAGRPGDADSGVTCDQILDDYRSVLSRMDRELNRPEGEAETLFGEALRALAARPPVPSGELSSYESVLGNTFHLFRALGRNRLAAVLAYSGQGDRLLEPFAAAGYSYLVSRERCRDASEARLSLAQLAGYGTFLMDTLGGQAYLHRRTPRQEALITLYALLIADEAIEKGADPHGFDPRPHLARCRTLIETQDLVYRERYRALLDRLASRWG